MGFAQAVIVLIGVFYFINAACLKSSSDRAGYAPAPNCAEGLPTLSILEPSDGEVRGTVSADGNVAVRIQVGVQRTSADCEPASLLVMASANKLACQGQLMPQQVSISAANPFANLRLAPGSYELAVEAFDADSQSYDPPVTTNMHINVVAALPDGGLPLDGGTLCLEVGDGAIP